MSLVNACVAGEGGPSHPQVQVAPGRRLQLLSLHRHPLRAQGTRARVWGPPEQHAQQQQLRGVLVLPQGLPEVRGHGLGTGAQAAGPQLMAGAGGGHGMRTQSGEASRTRDAKWLSQVRTACSQAAEVA